jgi:hypothetical protein
MFDDDSQVAPLASPLRACCVQSSSQAFDRWCDSSVLQASVNIRSLACAIGRRVYRSCCGVIHNRKAAWSRLLTISVEATGVRGRAAAAARHAATLHVEAITLLAVTYAATQSCISKYRPQSCAQYAVTGD